MEDDELRLVMETAKELDCSLKTARHLIGLENRLARALEVIGNQLLDAKTRKKGGLDSTGLAVPKPPKPQDRSPSGEAAETGSSKAKEDVAKFRASWKPATPK